MRKKLRRRGKMKVVDRREVKGKGEEKKERRGLKEEWRGKLKKGVDMRKEERR